MSDNVFSQVQAAMLGDVIRLSKQVSANNLNIRQDEVTLTSTNAGEASLIKHDESKPGLFTIIVTGNNVTISNLKFSGEKSISLRIDGDNCTLRNLEFENVKVAIIASGKNVDLKNIKVKGFHEDGIRLASDGFRGENIRIEDLYAKNKEAHHDGIQLYAGKPGSSFRHEGRYEGRYAIDKGYLKNVKIRSTTNPNRSGIGQLQGIFSADGFIDGIQLEDIHIETHDCVHGVSLRGVRDASDGTRSTFKNVSVSCTPGIKSKVTPGVRLTSTRRITEDGRRAYLPQSSTKGLMDSGVGDPFELRPDESNIKDVLFPSEGLRGTDESARSINKYWEAVPAGELDELQQRITIYQALLDVSRSPVFQDFRG